MAQIMPEIWVDDVGDALRYYEEVLGFNRRLSIPGEGGKVVHAEVDFNGSNPIMIAWAVKSPGAVDAVLEKLRKGGNRGSGILLYVNIGDADIDAYHEKVVAKGAKVVEPLRDQFYGDRTFRIEDPFGFVLTFARHIGEGH